MRGWVLVVALVLVAGGVRAEGWAVRAVPRPEGPGTRCVLESEKVSLPDGYQATTAQVVVDARSITVTSPSTLDGSFRDIGIAVDQEPLVPMDSLGDPRSARFEARYGALVEQFKQGARARLQLRFWPTWPATGTHSAVVSLIGFTRAYTQLLECR